MSKGWSRLSAHAQRVAVGAALVQQHAVHHRVEPLRRQQFLADQPQRAGVGGIGQALQGGGDALLRRPVDGGLYSEVEAVQAVEARHRQLPQQLPPQGIRALAPGVVDCLRRRRLGQEAQPHLQRRVAQLRADHTLRTQQAQVAVGQGLQPVVVQVEVQARPALGQQQAQHVLVGVGQPGQVRGVVLGNGQVLTHLRQLHAVVGPQAVAQADHLAVAGTRGERHRVEVGGDQPAPRLGGVAAAGVGAQGGAGHLPQLLGVALGAPFG